MIVNEEPKFSGIEKCCQVKGSKVALKVKDANIFKQTEGTRA